MPATCKKFVLDFFTVNTGFKYSPFLLNYIEVMWAVMTIFTHMWRLPVKPFFW